ncbi:MAG: ribosome biogenesis domain-containing protein [Planctomycetota bacterium]
MPDSPPPTVIVVHPREKRSKCSVEPLRGRDDFVFWTFPDRGPESLDGYIRLGLGGPELSAADAEHGLLVLDGTWRLAARMEPFYLEQPVRTLPALRTAYPRTSKLFDDPTGGLATIEAVYAALKILGRDTTGLLDDYRWGQEFLELNSDVLGD